MRQFKVALAIALAVILQSSLRGVWPPLGFIDLPLIVAVYYGLRRELTTCLLVAALAGLGADLLSGGLLGAGLVSKVVAAYVTVSLALRVMVDNPLARIPVLAGATAISTLVYIGSHVLLGQTIPQHPLVEWVAKQLFATTAVGSLLMLIVDNFFSERARQKRQFATRRRVSRR
jgi:rod shape-determining protein MreD